MLLNCKIIKLHKEHSLSLSVTVYSSCAITAFLYKEHYRGVGNFAMATNSFWIFVIRTRTFELKCPDTPIRFKGDFVRPDMPKIRFIACKIYFISAIIRQ